ncbi:MAG: glutamine synthetase III [Lachnospiraceae bacterium]|nr:glutamine synthetase III [Lachnospiraceae bacterium]
MYENLEEEFGKNVFTLTKMRERLPKDVYRELLRVMDEGGDLKIATANVIASAMKGWAIENGATHYSHWFQPLTGITAEKHDSFVSNPDERGRMITEFSGKELIKGEPDASSFPSGGLRATFEARGYTAWDMTSPAFLKESSCGTTLCIPTAFCSYTGEALDKKTPLLRSMEALSDQALRIVHLFGNTEAKKVTAMVGPEQEYFLVDEELYKKRQDLMFAGRTLFGAPAPKGQEMDDHYFGVIQERVGAFMKELNEELWKIGVTAKTEHNEVAPAQHELACIYETANMAADHNQLVMETMKRVAVHHHMRCLLNEKPYAGVNGSGKHNNWSMSTDNGVNLLDPGETPNENIQFLFVLSCIIKAVDIHADLLRQSASVPGNDYRLGGSEAPPAVLSVFLGEQLEDVVTQLVETGEATHAKKGGRLTTGVRTLPDLARDATDRNRTSPFAFTGNKFEFRMVGSSDSISGANTVLNSIVAEAFCDAADVLEKAAEEGNFETAVHDMIKENLSEHQRIIFNGDGYSGDWQQEAENRGLPNLRTMIEAADALTTEKAVKLFGRFGIFTENELMSRREIIYEIYAKTVNIEALTMIGMAGKQIIPAAVRYAGMLSDCVNSLSAAGADNSSEKEMLSEVTREISAMRKALKDLRDAEERARKIEDDEKRAFFYRDCVRSAMDALRGPADRLEMMVDSDIWPIPTYGELMFEV